MQILKNILLCIPSVIFGILIHYQPNQALTYFLILTFLHIMLGIYFCIKRNISVVILLIFLESLALNLFYITYTPYNIRQHDVGKFIGTGKGHFQYIYYLMHNHTLPFLHQEPFYPVCHPPLHYILSALFLSVFPGYENLQYMTLVWSFGCRIVSFLCLKLIIKDKYILVLSALFCGFFPAFTIYSGSLNNDVLCNFLCIISIFCFLLHIKTDKIKFLVLSSLFLGLSALTKISIIPMVYAGIFIFYIGLVLMRQIKLKDAVKRFLLYSIICLPIMLAWPVYNYVRWNGYPIFGVHLWGHVGTWSETLHYWFSGYNPFLHSQDITLNQHQYVGSYSLFERLGVIFEPLTKPFILRETSYPLRIPEYNIWTGLIKTSLFDEFSIFFAGKSIINTIGYWLSVVLLALNYIIFFFFIAAFFKTSKKDPAIFYCKCVLIAVILGFIYWCLRNPVWSAISFRYIATLFPCICFIAAQYAQDILSIKRNGTKYFINIFGIIIFLFSLIAITIYVLYGCAA